MHLPFKLLVLPGLLAIACLGQGCQSETTGAQGDPSKVKPAARYVIGLSPFLEKEDKNEVYRRVADLVLERMPLGSSLWIYDAYHIRTITQVDIPDLRAFRSGKTRAIQFKDQIHDLKTFLAREHPRPDTPELTLVQAVKFPQFMRFVGENLNRTGPPPMVLVLGSPLYFDPKEPGFSMVNGYFPSDGHLAATEEQSVYSLEQRDSVLDDILVSYGYFGDPWVNEIHQEKINRFWTLYLQGQGGRLASFCGDLPTAFGVLSRSAPEAAHRLRQYERDPESTKVEMIRINRNVEISDWITSDHPANLRTRPPSTRVGPMKIGIRWKGNLDLDLYARPREGGDTLSFHHTRIPEGYYFKDHRSSPDKEYEFIEFEADVDVREVEAAVNFYQGHQPGGPSGEIRIEFDGGIYVGRFHLEGDRGNRARSGTGSSPCWTSIDILRILRLRGS